jgi:hypothetical protein
MKKLIRFLVLTTFILTAPILIDSLSAQPWPGEQGDGSSVGGAPIGGGAPVGGGSLILLALGAAYGSRKVYILRRKEQST